jgi:carbamoyl-phosphate synthase small subunit
MVLQSTKKNWKNNPDLEITHVHLNDGTVAGMRRIVFQCSTIQSKSGPHDSSYLFDQLLKNIKG